MTMKKLPLWKRAKLTLKLAAGAFKRVVDKGRDRGEPKASLHTWR
jgi:hypothetical protein